MTRRRAVAVGAVAALVITAGGMLAAPGAGAQAGPVGQRLTGNFIGDDREEVIAYRPGAGRDLMVQFVRDGDPGEPIWFDQYDLSISGTFTPVVGDFDGDGFDEVLWYAPGSARDYLWDFVSFTDALSREYPVSGTYRPVAGDFTADGTDDIFWYGPGAAPDHLWEYDAGGSYTSTPRSVAGSYTPLAGSFGSDATDDVIWYAPGAGADSLWDFHPDGTHTARPLAVGGTYTPFVLDIWEDGAGGEDVFWYAPGPAADTVWDFVDGVPRPVAEPVRGTYVPAAGDLFDDGNEDVVWYHPDGFVVWDHVGSDAIGGIDRHQYDFGYVRTGGPRAAAGHATVPGRSG